MIPRDQLLVFGYESSRIRFEKLDDSYFNQWVEFCSDHLSMKYLWSGYLDKSPIERAQLWFDKCHDRYEKQQGGMNVLIDKISGDFLGQAGLLIQNFEGIEELEIGYSLMPHARGKGYAIEAAQFLKNYAFENKMVDTLISAIHSGNQSSAKVAISNGMSLEKTILENNSEIEIYSIQLSDWG